MVSSVGFHISDMREREREGERVLDGGDGQTSFLNFGI